LPSSSRPTPGRSWRISASASRGLDRVIRASYELLGYISFFTSARTSAARGPSRAAPRRKAAAGEIHTDLSRGFIRAEVVAYDRLVARGSMAACRDHGEVRLEGKEYTVLDGDIINVSSRRDPKRSWSARWQVALRPGRRRDPGPSTGGPHCEATATRLTWSPCHSSGIRRDEILTHAASLAHAHSQRETRGPGRSDHRDEIPVVLRAPPEPGGMAGDTSIAPASKLCGTSTAACPIGRSRVGLRRTLIGLDHRCWRSAGASTPSPEHRRTGPCLQWVRAEPLYQSTRLCRASDRRTRAGLRALSRSPGIDQAARPGHQGLALPPGRSPGDCRTGRRRQPARLVEELGLGDRCTSPERRPRGAARVLRGRVGCFPMRVRRGLRDVTLEAFLAAQARDHGARFRWHARVRRRRRERLVCIPAGRPWRTRSAGWRRTPPGRRPWAPQDSNARAW